MTHCVLTPVQLFLSGHPPNLGTSNIRLVHVAIFRGAPRFEKGRQRARSNAHGQYGHRKLSLLPSSQCLPRGRANSSRMCRISPRLTCRGRSLIGNCTYCRTYSASPGVCCDSLSSMQSVRWRAFVAPPWCSPVGGRKVAKSVGAWP